MKDRIQTILELWNKVTKKHQKNTIREKKIEKISIEENFLFKVKKEHTSVAKP